MAKRGKNKTTYTVVSLGGKKLGEDLGDCLVMTCSNLVLVEAMTGIKRDRLTYVFSRKKRNYMSGNDCLVFKSYTYYSGEHKGGVVGLKRAGFVRDY